MSGEMRFYLAAVLAVILYSLSKCGFFGLSSLAMSMLSLVPMTRFARSLYEPLTGFRACPSRKPDRSRSTMNAIRPVAHAHGRIAEQFPAFAAIGLVGYSVDAGITYVCAKYLGLSPELARPPGFIIATVVNFALNRTITFRRSRAPLVRSFVRYCLVASAGLAVNYSVYSACVLLAPSRCSSPPGAARRWS
jgi:putative flippase GtrA